jgi:hypothetical protein
MIDANVIRAYRGTAVDFDETEQLKKHLHSVKQIRNPFYLDHNDFKEILRWKLRQQYGRGKGLRSKNTEEIIKKITSLALNISHEDKDYELELRFKLLTTLRGVGVPVASAILALCFPEQYAVIDFRGWRQVFGAEKRSFTLNDYKRYLKEVKRLATELEWLPQEVDLAIWEYDRQKSRR